MENIVVTEPLSPDLSNTRKITYDENDGLTPDRAIPSAEVIVEENLPSTLAAYAHLRKSQALKSSRSLHGSKSNNHLPESPTKIDLGQTERFESGRSNMTRRPSIVSAAGLDLIFVIQWCLVVIGKNLTLITLVAGFYCAIASVPFAQVFEDGNHVGAGLLFSFSQVFVAFAISFSGVFWIRAILGYPFSIMNKVCWYPGIAYCVVSCTIYCIISLAGAWPAILLPVYGGGGLFTCIIPPVVYMGLPDEFKSKIKSFSYKDPQFRKFVKAALVVGFMNGFWFILLAFYLVFNAFYGQNLAQLVVLVCFKILTNLFIMFRCKLAESAVLDRGAEVENNELDHKLHRRSNELSAFSKLEIEAMHEVYLSMALPALHSWTVFGLSVALDNSLTFFELMHDEHSNVIGAYVVSKKIILFVVAYFFGAKEEKYDVETPAVQKSVSAAATLSPDAPARCKSVELTAGSNKGSTAEIPTAYMELDPRFLKRIEHFFIGIVAKIFGIIMFVTLLPVFFYGPNGNWYSGTFTLDFFEQACIKAAVALACMLATLTLGYFYVNRKKHVNVFLLGLNMLNSRWFQLVVSIYFIAPVFPYSQLGRHFMTVWWFDGLFGNVKEHTA